MKLGFFYIELIKSEWEQHMKNFLLTLGIYLTTISLYANAADLKAINLPAVYNSPASLAIDSEDNVYFTSPNFHNNAFIESGDLKVPATPAIVRVKPDNSVSTWYEFKSQDMALGSAKIAPMGIAIGPDGNYYVADMQLWFSGKHTSRIVRINVENGVAIDMDVVVEGMNFPNALAWRGNDLYVTDTVLETDDDKTISGIYRFKLSELSKAEPLRISPHKSIKDTDVHLFETFTSNGKLKFGANGLAVDGEGNLYTSIMEEGSVMKTSLTATGEKLSSELFTDGMKATDGMSWDRRTNRLYITDLFDNAVYSIDMSGNKQLLARNGDTDGKHGELDGPAEVIIRGSEAIVTNFDAVFDSPEMKNKKAEAPITLSVIKL